MTEEVRPKGGVRVASDPRWHDDPSPAWDDIAPGWPFHRDTPDDPSGGIDQITAKLWPSVHPTDQEARP